MYSSVFICITHSYKRVFLPHAHIGCGHHDVLPVLPLFMNICPCICTYLKVCEYLQAIGIAFQSSDSPDICHGHGHGHGVFILATHPVVHEDDCMYMCVSCVYVYVHVHVYTYHVCMRMYV